MAGDASPLPLRRGLGEGCVRPSLRLAHRSPLIPLPQGEGENFAAWPPDDPPLRPQPDHRLRHRARRNHRHRGRLVRSRRGRNPRHRRRVRLRQERHRAHHHGPAAAPARAHRRRGSALRRRSTDRPQRSPHAAHPRPRHRHGVPGADDLAEPGVHHRRAGHGDDPRARTPGQPRDVRPRGGDAGQGRHPVRRGAHGATIRTSFPAASASA